MREFLYRLATDRYRGFPFSILKGILWMLSLVYCVFIVMCAALRGSREKRMPLKVISVGNITLGGTGKTPLVEYICRFLKEHGHRFAVVTRGYTPAHKEASGGAAIADEPQMLSERLEQVPVIVKPDRVEAISEASRTYGADGVVLDDGFQQWHIHKDIEIVTVDGVNPFGNGRLLPRGILREPLFALKRADVFVITKTNCVPDISVLRRRLESINQSALIVESKHTIVGVYEFENPGRMHSLGSLKGKIVTVLSGIGDPHSFESMLKEAGVCVGLSFQFSDHHAYTHDDLASVTSASRNKGIDTILTTEKDGVRLRHLNFQSLVCTVMVARLEIVLTNGKDQFLDRLHKLYSV